MQPNLNDKIQQAKAAGYSDTEIQGYLQQTGFQPPAPTGGLRVTGAAPARPTTTAAPAQSQIRGRGGTLTSLISEGGALGGALTGAAIGSAVPVIGTAIGGIIGAGIGAFGGRLAENKVRDDRLGVTDALKEGALSAALAGPLRGLKYGATATKGLLAGKGAQQAFTTAAKKATDLSIRKSLGLGVTKASKDLVIKQFRLTPSQLTNFNKKFGEDVTELVSRYGIGTADDVATKGINPLQSVFDDIVDNIPDIPKKNLKALLDKEIKTLLNSPVETNRLLGQRLQSQANTLLKGQPSKIPGVVAKKLRQEFDDAVNYTLAGTPERTVAKRTADSLRKLLQNSADDAGLVAPNGMSMKQLGREISKLKDLDEIVTKQGNLGRGSLPFNLPSGLGAVSGAVAGGAGAIGGTVLGGPLGGLAGFAGAEFLNSPAGRRLLAQLGQGTGQALVKSGTRAAAQPIRQAVAGATRAQLLEGLTTAGTASAQAPQTLEQALMVTPTTAETLGGVSPESVYTPETAALGAGLGEEQITAPTQTRTARTTSRTTGATAGENPFTPEILIMAIAADPKNAALYERLYKIYETRYAAPKTAKLTTTAIKQLSDYDKSIANLDEVENLIRSSSSAFGPVRGALRGAIPQDVTAKAIRQATLIAAQNIGRALEGGKLTDADILRYQQALPKITDTPQVALNKIDRLRRLIQQEAQTYGQLTAELGGAQSLEDALLAQTGGTE